MLNWFSLLHYLNISHTIRDMKNHVFYNMAPCWLFTNILEELSASIVSVKGCLTPSMEMAGTLKHWQPPVGTGAKSPRQWVPSRCWWHQLTHCYISEDLNLLRLHCGGTLKSGNNERISEIPLCMVCNHTVIPLSPSIHVFCLCLVKIGYMKNRCR